MEDNDEQELNTNKKVLEEKVEITKKTNISPRSQIKQRSKLLEFLISFHIPIGLIIFLIIALIYPAPGAYLAKTPAQPIIIGFLFFLSGTRLKTEEVKNLVHHKLNTLIGVFYILILSPLICLIVMKLPYEPHDFLIGFCIFLSGPTCLMAGIILVGQIHGNVTLALVLVVSSCVISIISEPIMIKLIFKLSNFKMKFDVISLLIKLFLTILLPLLFGKLMTVISSWFRRLVEKYKTLSKCCSSFIMMLTPWMNLSESSDKLLHITLSNILFLIISAIIIHSLLFITIFIITIIFKTPYNEKKSLTIIGCEKTLPNALTVLAAFPDEIGDKGVIVLPLLVTHFTQLIIDTLICSFWTTYDKKYHRELFEEIVDVPNIEMVEKSPETPSNNTNEIGVVIENNSSNKKKGGYNKLVDVDN